MGKCAISKTAQHIDCRNLKGKACWRGIERNISLRRHPIARLHAVRWPAMNGDVHAQVAIVRSCKRYFRFSKLYFSNSWGALSVRVVLYSGVACVQWLKANQMVSLVAIILARHKGFTHCQCDDQKFFSDSPSFSSLIYIHRFYTAESSTFTTGPPGNGVVGRPTTISPCELEQLSRDCVARINDYRTGKIGFSNGAANPTLPDLKPLFEQTNGHQCSNRQVR